MTTEADDSIDDDIDSNELLQELYENGQDSGLTRLTEMVRNHYLNYLEKQLQENLVNSKINYKKNGIHNNDENYDEETCKKYIKQTAELLEDKAVKACMIAKFYQRAMVKIIAIVRRTTQEKRLITHLEKCIQTKDELNNKQITHLEKCIQTKDEHNNKQKSSSKGTQTEYEIQEQASNEPLIQSPPTHQIERDKQIMSLDEKIEMFQKHLQKEKCNDNVKKYPLKDKKYKMSKRHQHKPHPRQYEHHSYHQHHEQHELRQELTFSPAPSSIITVQTSPKSLILIQPPLPPPPALENNNLNKSTITCVAENENSNDSVAMELARLFSEEKTELDEIFGIDPNEEPDDPQICKILKEIEEAKLNQTKPAHKLPSSIMEDPPNETSSYFADIKATQTKPSIDPSETIDLSKSIWPCELFMQKRKLSESLAKLIEEDLRWHDIMKWKFSQLFGEDSDDEFTPCSPSIEMDEVLVGSCVRRISPWVVKHLMSPMKDGLIANRFLFKKLAKTLARNIVMENQYPDEFIVKDYVENFFCLHQAVMSLDDIDVDMPSISSF